MESDFIASTQNFLLRCVKIKFRSHKLHANDRSSRICLLISKYRSKKKLSTYHSQHRVEIFRFDPFFSLFCLTRFDLLIVDEFKFFCDVSFFSARSSKINIFSKMLLISQSQPIASGSCCDSEKWKRSSRINKYLQK